MSDHTPVMAFLALTTQKVHAQCPRLQGTYTHLLPPETFGVVSAEEETLARGGLGGARGRMANTSVAEVGLLVHGIFKRREGKGV